MHIRKFATIGIIILALTPAAFADGVAQAVDGLESDVDALESQISALQTENAALEAVIASLTVIVDALVEQQRCHTRPGDLQADADGNYAGGVDWRGCDKTGLSMWGPAVGGAVTENLTNADLRGANLTLANIIGVEFGANLEGAVFKNANLAYSNMEGANIIGPDGAQYGKEPTVFINTFCPDGTNSNDVGGTCANNRTP
jgi:uncharacterized protein YjbI with pentapeptide repeats